MSNDNQSTILRERLEKIKSELAVLDKESVTINGLLMKPSQCYRLGLEPPHILFNTNCPEQVKHRVMAIVSSYIKQ